MNRIEIAALQECIGYKGEDFADIFERAVGEVVASCSDWFCVCHHHFTQHDWQHGGKCPKGEPGHFDSVANFRAAHVRPAPAAAGEGEAKPSTPADLEEVAKRLEGQVAVMLHNASCYNEAKWCREVAATLRSHRCGLGREGVDRPTIVCLCGTPENANACDHATNCPRFSNKPPCEYKPWTFPLGWRAREDKSTGYSCVKFRNWLWYRYGNSTWEQVSPAFSESDIRAPELHGRAVAETVAQFLASEAGQKWQAEHGGAEESRLSDDAGRKSDANAGQVSPVTSAPENVDSPSPPAPPAPKVINGPCIKCGRSWVDHNAAFDIFCKGYEPIPLPLSPADELAKLRAELVVVKAERDKLRESLQTIKDVHGTTADGVILRLGMEVYWQKHHCKVSRLWGNGKISPPESDMVYYADKAYSTLQAALDAAKKEGGK